MLDTRGLSDIAVLELIEQRYGLEATARAFLAFKRRRVQRSKDPAMQQQIVDLYLTGLPATHVAARLQVSPDCVWNVLRDHGYNFSDAHGRHHRARTDEQRQDAARLGWPTE